MFLLRCLIFFVWKCIYTGRKGLNDCQNEASTVVSSNEECWQFNKAWKEGKDQIIRFPEDGEAIRSGECLDQYG